MTAAILNFRKHQLSTFTHIDFSDWVLGQNLYENWTKGTGDILIGVFFKMAAGGHIEFSKMPFLTLGHLGDTE